MDDNTSRETRLAGWMTMPGSEQDVVVSSRIRLARNIAGYVFFGKADYDQQSQIYHLIQSRIMETELRHELQFVRMDQMAALDRAMLNEKQLVSRKLLENKGYCGAAISRDEGLVLMINEEDHLRIQVLTGGLNLKDGYERINRVQDIIEQQLAFSFSSHYGYLTACPTNLGTGIRVSVMMHLPALKMTGHIEKVFRAAKDMRLAIRGLYGEGTEPIGDLYQVSNQTTLGRSEEQILELVLEQAVTPIIGYERQAREKMLTEKQIELDDKVFRAYGLLKHSRLITTEEALYMLSMVRLGVHLGRIKDIGLQTLSELFLYLQPAHLQKRYGKQMEPRERDIYRAELIRKRLSG